MLQEPAGDCVTRLVIRHRFLLLRLKDIALLFHAGHDSLDSLFKVAQFNGFVQIAGGDQSSFVTHVGNVSTCESWSQCSHFTSKVVLVQVTLQSSQMDFEDGGTT